MEFSERNCTECDNCHRVSAQGGWTFLACFCEPYKGKWVAEIKECPKEGGVNGVQQQQS